MITPIIKPQELILGKDQKELVLIDTRTGPAAKEKYLAEHLEGALYVDLESALVQKKEDPANGGRHPLPDIAKFAEVVGSLGINPQSQVVVYDDKNGANAAARFWWMLKAIGHGLVQVLDGGYQAAVAAGMPTSSGAEVPTYCSPYPYSNWILPLVSMDVVAKAVQNPELLIIDVRDPERFRGEIEPIDLIAGHIPGAINIPFTSNLDPNGFFLSPAELYSKYKQAFAGRKSEQVVVHCGSGVTACHTLLALDYAGIQVPNLYVGSWSEWSRNNYPIATNE